MAEVTVAVNFLLSHLYHKLPRRRVDLFGEALDRNLRASYTRQQCSSAETDASKAEPTEEGAETTESKDKEKSEESIFQLYVCGDQSHPLIFQAANESGMDLGELLAYLPQDLLFTIRPGAVSYQLGVSVDSHAQHHLIYCPGVGPSMYGPDVFQRSLAMCPDTELGAPHRPVPTLITSPSGHHLYPPPRVPHHSHHHGPQIDASEHLTQQLGQLSVAEAHHSPPRSGRPATAWQSSNSAWSSLSPSPTNTHLSGHPNLRPQLSHPGPGHYPLHSPRSPLGPPPGIAPIPGSGCPPHHPSAMSNYSLLQSHYLQKSNSTPNFTASTFAQTKFGSTKLRTQPHRPKRSIMATTLGLSQHSQHQLSPGMSAMMDGGPTGHLRHGGEPAPSSSAMFLGPPSMYGASDGAGWSHGGAAGEHPSLRPPRSSSTQQQLNRMVQQPTFLQLPHHPPANSGTSSGFGTAGCPSMSGSNLMPYRSLSLSPYAPLASTEMYEDFCPPELLYPHLGPPLGRRDAPGDLICEHDPSLYPYSKLGGPPSEEGDLDSTSSGSFPLAPPQLRPHHYSFPSQQHPPPQWLQQRRTSGPGGLQHTNPTFNIYGPDEETVEHLLPRPFCGPGPDDILLEHEPSEQRGDSFVLDSQSQGLANRRVSTGGASDYHSDTSSIVPCQYSDTARS